MKRKVVFRIPRSRDVLRSSYSSLFSCLSAYVDNYKKACIKSRNGQDREVCVKAGAAEN